MYQYDVYQDEEVNRFDRISSWGGGEYKSGTVGSTRDFWPGIILLKNHLKEKPRDPIPFVSYLFYEVKPHLVGNMSC